MANVRSIALLDTFRKILTKTLSMRLDIIFSTNNDTLCPQNYCGLPGDSTSTPIHVLNNIIDITGLDLALRRLALPDRLVDLSKEYKGWQAAKIIEKSQNSESLTVEICHITEFEPQLGNLYRLEKPNSKITKVIHRRAARVVNQTIDNGPVTINTPMNITDSQQLRSISTINRWESDTDNYIMMDHVQPIKENRNTEQIQKWFGSSELGKSLMATKDRLSNLDQLHFYTDGSLKKHHYRTIQDGNAILNNRWDSASSSTSASNIVQFNQGHDGLNFVPMINEVPVEQKLRKFVKNVMNFVNDGQWSQLSCNQDALLDRTKDYDWDITWNALKQVKHFKCTSSKHNKLWALWAF
ncbi:1709_t:CDS:2, partial [Rhizophagus irregularis]